MTVGFVGDRFVDLVADEHQIVTVEEFSDRFRLRLRSTVPTGFHGVLSNNTRRGGSSRRLQRLDVELKSSILQLPARLRIAACQPDRRLVGIVNRIRHQHFIAIVQQRRQRRVDAEGGAGGDEDLRVRIVAESLSRSSFSAMAWRSLGSPRLSGYAVRPS